MPILYCMEKESLKSLLLGQYQNFEALDLGVPRELLKSIKIQQNSPYALIISGLRRVGKSTLLAQIARTYYQDQYYFVNFDDERFLNFKAQDFHVVQESLVELFGKRRIFIFDEVQNIENWETFCRRLIDEGYKLFISGSNASLLSKALGTRLTGRYVPLELLPFSFREYLAFEAFDFDPGQYKGVLTTVQKGQLLSKFNDYVKKGGIALSLKFPNLEVHKTLYENVIFRDIVSRYEVKHEKELRELALYLLSNVGKPFAYNKLKGNLGLGSVTTVKNFIHYLTNSWLFFMVSSFRFSLKDQTGPQSTKKMYAIDTGIIFSLAFRLSEEKGRLLENIVLLELIRRHHEIYFFRTKKNREVDFYLKDAGKLIQVCATIENKETQKREVEALVEAMDELKVTESLILTESEERTIESGQYKIQVLPIYKWLLFYD